MRSRSLMIVLLSLFLPTCAIGQTTATVAVDGQEAVLTVWAGDPHADATVLLVPGWGGGPEEVLGMADFLSSNRVPAVVLTPRGWHASEGRATFAGSLEDIAEAVDWIRSSGHPGLSSQGVVLGGHSWGGGISLVYAARDSTIRRVFSVAGTDHALLIRQVLADPDYGGWIRSLLRSTQAPDGPIRFSVEYTLGELERGQDLYGLLDKAALLADRHILLIGGWEDTSVKVEETILPLYRALREAGAEDVTFRVYHAEHGFGSVREDLHGDLLAWLQGKNRP